MSFVRAIRECLKGDDGGGKSALLSGPLISLAHTMAFLRGEQTGSQLSTGGYVPVLPQVREGKINQIRDLDKLRREAGVDLMELLFEAGVTRNSWYLGIKHPGATRYSTLEKLAGALDRLRAGEPKRAAVGAVLALVRIIALVIKQTAPLVLTKLRRQHLHQRPEDRLAVYLVAVEIQVPNVIIGRALSISRQAVKKTRDEVEEWREHPDVDALLDALAPSVRGEGMPVSIAQRCDGCDKRRKSHKIAVTVAAPSLRNFGVNNGFHLCAKCRGELASACAAGDFLKRVTPAAQGAACAS